MKKNNKIIITIASVVAIVIVTAGATFAYWNWIMDPSEETDIDFEVIGDNITQKLYANLNGNSSEIISNLEPTACTSDNAIKKEISINYLNKMKQSATITATLKVSDFRLRNNLYVPTTDELKYLKYAITTTPNSCESDIAIALNGEQMTGNFSELIFEDGDVTNLPLELFSYNFTADSNMNVENELKYYLWIWLDQDYVHINVGNNNTDAMQGIEFRMTWSGTVAQNSY